MKRLVDRIAALEVAMRPPVTPPRVVVWCDDAREDRETVVARDRAAARRDGTVATGDRRGLPHTVVVTLVSGVWQQRQDGTTEFVRPPRAAARYRARQLA